MKGSSALPSVIEIQSGHAIFRDDMPIWFGYFGEDVWPFRDPRSPLYQGETTSSFVWRDYIEGRGATFGHSNSRSKSKYTYCLTLKIVVDLKVAAVIHAFFPTMIKNARTTKEELDPQTVKGRIEELARFFSLVIINGRERLGIEITRLSEIPFPLLVQTIAMYPGRGAHLKRALKLISEPMVQVNLAGPLQWGILDITNSSIAWPESRDLGGIDTLSDEQFLFLLKHCKRAIARFKSFTGIPIIDSETQALGFNSDLSKTSKFGSILNAYYAEEDLRPKHFLDKYGTGRREINEWLVDGHNSAMMLILLLTAMRDSEIHFLMRGCLTQLHGYWFLNSKVVKGRPKDVPISEGWLAIDLTRDAYDVLMTITGLTGNAYLFSSPHLAYIEDEKGYTSALNTKFNRWLKKIDTEGVFEGWTFSVHQCRETLVAQLARQEVGMVWISILLKHFESQLNAMPNEVTARYGQYRKQLMTGVNNRLAIAREDALLDLYGEDKRFAGGGGPAHKARIDTFFSGMGLSGESRAQYIRKMATRGGKLMPRTSIGGCANDFSKPVIGALPPCYGDYHCDPDCGSHVLTENGREILIARRDHAKAEGERETDPAYKTIWLGLVEKLEPHINKLQTNPI